MAVAGSSEAQGAQGEQQTASDTIQNTEASTSGEAFSSNSSGQNSDKD